MRCDRNERNCAGFLALTERRMGHRTLLFRSPQAATRSPETSESTILEPPQGLLTTSRLYAQVRDFGGNGQPFTPKNHHPPTPCFTSISFRTLPADSTSGTPTISTAGCASTTSRKASRTSENSLTGTAPGRSSGPSPTQIDPRLCGVNRRSSGGSPPALSGSASFEVQ